LNYDSRAAVRGRIPSSLAWKTAAVHTGQAGDPGSHLSFASVRHSPRKGPGRANRLGDHEEAIDFIMDAPGISPRHLVLVIDAGLVRLPGRHTSGYDRTAQAIIAADKHTDVGRPGVCPVRSIMPHAGTSVRA
jgi:hypothetical protein